jgi:Mrp family chromosome partitioning ATPase
MQNGSDVNAARLGDYFVLLRRQWLVILLCLALGIGAALAYLQWAPKEYRSTTSVLVTEMETDGGTTTPRGTAINLDTEAQLVTSTETVARAADVIGIPAGSAVDRVAVSVPPNTEILDISYLGSTAAAAQQGSSAFAEAYLQQREATGRQILDTQADALQDRIDAVDDQLSATLKEADKLKGTAKQRANDQASRLDAQLSTLESNQARLRTETLSPGRVITQARLPRSPSSPDPLVTLAAGVLVGAAVGLGLAALRHRRDDLIRTPDDLVRRTHVPVAAVLSKPLHSGEVSLLGPLAADGRAYARLRNLVTTALGETDRRVVLVAGVRRGGGPVAANLAASLARSGEDVYLVCADVFGPTATALLDGAPRAGLAEVLAGEVTLEAGTRNIRTVPHLRVLAPGLDPDRADALLQTTGLRTLIDDMLATASYVVIEAPPTTDSPDAQTLAGVADLAVLVVEAGQSSAREVVDADAQVEAM